MQELKFGKSKFLGGYKKGQYLMTDVLMSDLRAADGLIKLRVNYLFVADWKKPITTAFFL